MMMTMEAVVENASGGPKAAAAAAALPPALEVDVDAAAAAAAAGAPPPVTEAFAHPHPPMKHSDTRDSISSIDSDVCLAFDGGVRGQTTSSAEDEGAHLADTSDCGSDSGSTTGKDSGCEVEKAESEEREPPFVPPDEALAARIVQQVEFYFSDVNITKDAFLLKHVKRNKEGYVSLKLISSFKRVKHLAKDWRAVAFALAHSSKLEINDAGTKLRRRDPLPQYDQTTPSRTVVALRLPGDKPTIEHVAELFACFGDIALVRILRPGNPVPADVRGFVAKRPEMAGTVSALVEFSESESAQRATRGGAEWAGHAQGIAVVALNAPAPPAPPSKKRHATHAAKKSALARLVDAENSSSCASGSEAEVERQRPPPPSRHHPRVLPKAHSYHNHHHQQKMHQQQQTPGSPNRVISRARTAPELCPWLQRRLSARLLEAGGAISSDTVAAAAAAMRPRSNSGVAHLPENVVRMPKGPDGSVGFRSRQPPSSSTAAPVLPPSPPPQPAPAAAMVAAAC